jgi:outer membrane protein assembly factor BamB
MICGLEDELVCVARPTGEILCLSARTGIPVWGESLSARIVEVYSRDDRGAKLLVKIRQGTGQFLSKLDASSGLVAWELDAGPAGLFSVHDAGGLVLVSTAGSGTCAVLDEVP